jgi:hypothetical protein
MGGDGGRPLTIPPCSLWSKSRRSLMSSSIRLYRRKRTSPCTRLTSALCQMQKLSAGHDCPDGGQFLLLS